MIRRTLLWIIFSCGLSAQEIPPEIQADTLSNHSGLDENRDGEFKQGRKALPARAQDTDQVSATHADVAYGAHPRQVLDFWQANVDGPAPLIIYIHGGGFVGGSHKKIKGAQIQQCLNAGIHFASVEYRLLQDAVFPAPQEDAIRAVQFLRSKADEWNIDRNRIGAYGVSAGATLVSYVGFHDDYADPENDDPVARESSRLSAIAPAIGASTLDLNWWAENLPGYDTRNTAMYSIFSIGQPEETIAQVTREISPITHITPDDPPTFLSYRTRPDDPVPTNPRQLRNWVIHHVNFGVALEEKLKAADVEVHLKYPGVELPFDNEMSFLMHHLKP